MNFASDNWAGATPAVMEAVQRANGGHAPAYGDDELTARVTRIFSEIFEREVEIHFVATGTAANALAMAARRGRAGWSSARPKRTSTPASSTPPSSSPA